MLVFTAGKPMSSTTSTPRTASIAVCASPCVPCTPSFRRRSFRTSGKASLGRTPTILRCRGLQHPAAVGQRGAETVGAQLLPHSPDRLCDHGDRHDLQSVQPACVRGRGERVEAVGKRNQRQRRRHGEAEPRGNAACQPGLVHPERDAELTAGRTGQEIAHSDEVGVRRFIEPLASGDEFIPAGNSPPW